MKIYLHQTEINDDPENNLKKLMTVFEKNPESDIIICPEVFTSGFNYKRLSEIAIENQQTIKQIQNRCHEFKTAFLGSFFWKEGSHYFNRAFFIDENGQVLASYDKQHLIPAFKEDQYLRSGTKFSALSFKGMRIGLAICYDLRFPEFFRHYAMQEADLVFLLAQWPEERIDHMITLARARAIENQCYFVTVNAIGKSGKTLMGGHSMIIDPKGEILLDLKKSTSGKQLQIHLSEVLKWRTEFPALYQYSRQTVMNNKFLRWLNK